MVKVEIKENKNKYNNYAIGCLDIGKEKTYCYVENSSNLGGGYLKVFSFSTDLEGFMECYQNVETFRQSQDLEGILLGVESTGTYGDPITNWLQEKGIHMVGINPKHVHRMKEVLDNSPLKSDKKDPKVGTMLVRNNRFFQLIQPEGIAADLLTITRHRKQLKVSENRFLNQLESHVVRVFPEFISVMKSLDRTTSLHLLKHYALPEDIVNLGKSKLLKIIKEQSRFQLGAERSKELMKAAKESIGIKQGTLSIKLAVEDLISQINLIKLQILKAEKRLKMLLNQHEEAKYLLSVPGIGVISASEIIGETGGLNNFKNPDQLLRLAGLNLYELSSGNFKGQTRITKRGKANLRHTLYLMALRTIKKKGIYRDAYLRYLKTKKKPQAVIVVAKRILRTLFSLVKNQNEFDITIFNQNE